jgi:hypothetical protein
MQTNAVLAEADTSVLEHIDDPDEVRVHGPRDRVAGGFPLAD